MEIASRSNLQISLAGRRRPQRDGRDLQLVQQLPCVILVNAVCQQRLRHIPNLPLYRFQVRQRRQRVLRAPAPLNVRLLLMLVASVRILHRRCFALLSIPAELLAPPIVAISFFNNLALQCFAPTSTVGPGFFHR
jgi:hypothetical protein